MMLVIAIILAMGAFVAGSVAGWKLFDFFMSASEMIHTSPFQYYANKIVSTVLSGLCTAFAVLLLLDYIVH